MDRLTGESAIARHSAVWAQEKQAQGLIETDAGAAALLRVYADGVEGGPP